MRRKKEIKKPPPPRNRNRNRTDAAVVVVVVVVLDWTGLGRYLGLCCLGMCVRACVRACVCHASRCACASTGLDWILGICGSSRQHWLEGVNDGSDSRAGCAD